MAGNKGGAAKGWETRRAREREAQEEFERRSAASRRGWYTRKALERERQDAWEFDDTNEWIVEEPIDEVGGKYYE